MAISDYYDVLGVSKNASQDEIKKAYRKQALEWHPDRHRGSDKEASEKRFKEINEAYQVLSDPQKRQSYDQFGHDAFTKTGAAGNPFSSGFGPFSYSYSSNGQQFDFGDPFDIFEQFFGGGFARQSRKPRYSLKISFLEAVLGSEKNIEINGKNKTIKIPEGVDEGTKLDFNDFTLTINVTPSEEFERDGVDIYSKLVLPFSTFVLGGNVSVKTIKGEVEIRIRPSTQALSLIRLKGKGVKHLRGSSYGDHYVRLFVDIPSKIDSKKRTIVNEMKRNGM